VGDTQRPTSGWQRAASSSLTLPDDAALELAGVGEDRHTGAVIAAVFQALEAFDQDGGDIAFGNCANDSTHVVSPD
jgi:hypothetical protein